MQNNLPLPPPRRNELPVIRKLIDSYKLWHEFVPHIPKTSRYALGGKIDSLFLDVIENVFGASYLPNQGKLPVLIKSISKLDLVKFFLQIAWEIHVFDTKKYITISEKLDEIGRMLGGWRKGLEKKTPTHQGAGETAGFGTTTR